MVTQSRSRITLTKVIINPTNLKCSTLPLFSLGNQYSINFHLSWLGFFVAFLSWFAFAPLIPDAIKQDLHLTTAQVGNSNVVSLSATLLIRLITGSLVDRFGPRKVMAALLILGAIPSGLAGTINTANGLYVIRFFIGILGATFVTCQAWTTAFFDTNVVGTANALASGWGDAGGGFTFIIMVALYDSLLSNGLGSHMAWRLAFVVVPVPFLLTLAVAILVFGTDHPAGKWSDRHKVIVHYVSDAEPNRITVDEKGTSDEACDDCHKQDKYPNTRVTVSPAQEITCVVSESPTWKHLWKVITTSLTWLPALAYLTTFGYEIAICTNLASVLLSIYQSPTFGQTKAGYLAATFGMLNVFSRPLGGYFGDVVYKKFGIPGKKYLMIGLGVVQGLLSLGLGFYLDNYHHPPMAEVIVLLVVLAIANEATNGVNFSLVPHCNPSSNGFMNGIVGGMGSLGGIVFALVWRLQPSPVGRPFWICGIIAIVTNLLLVTIRVPRT